jgi:hypothetical protein
MTKFNENQLLDECKLFKEHKVYPKQSAHGTGGSLAIVKISGKFYLWHPAKKRPNALL